MGFALDADEVEQNSGGTQTRFSSSLFEEFQQLGRDLQTGI